jgi:hypothetical protein
MGEGQSKEWIAAEEAGLCLYPIRGCELGFVIFICVRLDLDNGNLYEGESNYVLSLY